MTTHMNDVIRVTAVMELQGASQVMNVFHVKRTNSGDATDDDTMEEIEQFMSDVYGSASNLFSTALLPVEIRGFNETQNVPLPVQSWTGWAGGTTSGDTMPAGCAALILFRTGIVRVLGRKFLGGLPTGQAVAGVLTGAALSVIATFAGTLMAGWNIGGPGIELKYVVRGKFGTTYFPIDATIRADVAYQRRRKPGVGV